MTGTDPGLLEGKIGLLRVASWAVAALPAGSGQGFVGRHLYGRWVSKRNYGEASARMRGGARFRLDLADRIQAQAFLTREYELPLVRFITRRIGEGGTFLDV